MLENSKPLERSAILAILPPIAATNARTSAYVDAKLYQSLEVKVLNGDASASGTITLLNAADTNGGSSVAVATVAFGGTGTTGDNQVKRISVMPSDMLDETRPYFAVSLGDNVALTAAIIEGFDPRYAPPDSIAAVTNAR